MCNWDFLEFYFKIDLLLCFFWHSFPGKAVGVRIGGGAAVAESAAPAEVTTLTLICLYLSHMKRRSC